VVSKWSAESRPGLLRYGLGGVMMTAGLVMGLSVLLINFLFRLGASGEQERDREEEAGGYFDEHGAWLMSGSVPQGVNGRSRAVSSPPSRRGRNDDAAIASRRVVRARGRGHTAAVALGVPWTPADNR
jgi:hypothetical protein